MSAPAVPVALASAACFAVASALQQRAARAEPPHPTMDPRLLLRLARRRLWLAGGLADLAGVGLQALALTLGGLALVQPLLASGLILAVPLEAALDRRPPGRRDLAAALLAAAGLSAFLLAAAPAGGVPEPSTRAWAWTAVATGPVVAGCLLAGGRSAGARRATYLGLATGVMYGVTAALLKACAERLATDPITLLGRWQLYALIVIGVAALVLNQNAFQDGPLAAPLTALTLADPAVGVLIGATAFQESISAAGPRTPAVAVAAIAMACGIWLASRSAPPAGHDLCGRALGPGLGQARLKR